MSTHRTDPQEQPQGVKLPARRSAGNRLRTAAASSMLAAASVTALGTVPAQAREPQDTAFSFPSEPSGEGREDTVRLQPPAGPDAAERLAGVRKDLANAVAWGSVTASQAEHFYARISARIARGL